MADRRCTDRFGRCDRRRAQGPPNSGRLPDALAQQPDVPENQYRYGDRELEAALAKRESPTVLVSNEVGFGIVPDNAEARRFAICRDGSISGSRRWPDAWFCWSQEFDAGERRAMSDIDDTEAARHRTKMAKRKARAGCRSRGQEDREGPADRPHRHRQGQINRGVRARAAHARPQQASRRRAVHQRRMAIGPSAMRWRSSAIRCPGTPWAKASPGTRRISNATSRRPSAPGRRRAS